jgi:hypothetical protein
MFAALNYLHYLTCHGQDVVALVQKVDRQQKHLALLLFFD